MATSSQTGLSSNFLVRNVAAFRREIERFGGIHVTYLPEGLVRLYSSTDGNAWEMPPDDWDGEGEQEAADVDIRMLVQKHLPDNEMVMFITISETGMYELEAYGDMIRGGEGHGTWEQAISVAMDSYLMAEAEAMWPGVRMGGEQVRA